MSKVLACDPQSPHGNKYIDVRFYFLWGHVRLEQVAMYIVASAKQHADIPSKRGVSEILHLSYESFMRGFVYWM